MYSVLKFLMPPLATGSLAQLRDRVGSVMPALNESPRRVRHSSADRELLIRNVLEAVGARQNVMSEWLWSRELELLLRDVTPVGSVMKERHPLRLVRHAGERPLKWTIWGTVASVSPVDSLDME